MGTTRREIWSTTAASDCPLLAKNCSARGVSTASTPSRCQTEDHDGCPTLLATVLARTRPSFRRFDDMGLSAK